MGLIPSLFTRSLLRACPVASGVTRPWYYTPAHGTSDDTLTVVHRTRRTLIEKDCCSFTFLFDY